LNKTALNKTALNKTALIKVPLSITSTASSTAIAVRERPDLFERPDSIIDLTGFH